MPSQRTEARAAGTSAGGQDAQGDPGGGQGGEQPGADGERDAPGRGGGEPQYVGPRGVEPLLLDARAARDGLVLDAYRIPTGDAVAQAAAGTPARFDAVWVLPGSPYAGEAGAPAAIRVAREEGVPFLGTCGGFRHTLLEYARTVCGPAWVAHAEDDPGAADPLIAPPACSPVGHEGVVRAEPGSLAEAALGCRGTTRTGRCASRSCPGTRRGGRGARRHPGREPVGRITRRRTTPQIGYAVHAHRRAVRRPSWWV
ncbi:hypothetical protein ACIRPF_30185 [Streptomyces erythrochromogenes]|uniref:hypothetical protein n=1 Tax=Streptomyces erythrochromogenes TaxID=285574 RepID=UPI00031C65F0